MKDEIDLGDHHALRSLYQDLFFCPPALSHLMWAGALCGKGCKRKQKALRRADGGHSSAMSGEIPRLVVSLWITIPVVSWGLLSLKLCVGDGRGRVRETLGSKPSRFLSQAGGLGRTIVPHSCTARYSRGAPYPPVHHQTKPWTPPPFRLRRGGQDVL